MIRSAVVAVLSVILFAGAVAPAVAVDDDPVAILTEIYGAYGEDSMPDDPQGRFFAPDLLSMYDDVQAGAGDNPELALDFDVFLNAQDIDMVTDLVTRVEKPASGIQIVDATFSAFGQRQMVQYAFVRTGEGWKIDNIAWNGEANHLRAVLARLKALQEAAN